MHVTYSSPLALLLALSQITATAAAAQAPAAACIASPGRATWQQQVELSAAHAAPDDHLGGPVALAGSMALVGAWHAHHGRGTAYLFSRQGDRWVPGDTLTAADGEPGDWFGASVALSGDTALVGAPLAGGGGAVYVFVRHGRHWSEQARLSVPGTPHSWFGRTVALSGSTALISAWYEQNDRGAAYVFERTDTAWRVRARLSASDARPDDYFGTSVALAGNVAAIGAAGADGNAGAVYLFGFGEGRWRQQDRLTAIDGTMPDTFGTSVALQGTTLLVGAGYAHQGSGSAYVFTRRSGQWQRQAVLTANDGAAGDWFGHAVALDGDSALVGAWYRRQMTGAAYLFARHGAVWKQQAMITADDGVIEDGFGGSVALSGGVALVGAGFKHQATGAVYVYRLGAPAACAMPTRDGEPVRENLA